MAYISVTEVAGITTYDFTDDPPTPITETQLVALIGQYSAKLDGLAGVDLNHFGDPPPQWVKSAILAAIAMKIENVYEERDHTEVDILHTMKMFIKDRDRTTTALPKFPSSQPNELGRV